MIGGKTVRVEVDDSSGLKETCGGFTDANKPGDGVRDNCTEPENLSGLQSQSVVSAVDPCATLTSPGPANMAKSKALGGRLLIPATILSEWPAPQLPVAIEQLRAGTSSWNSMRASSIRTRTLLTALKRLKTA